MVVPDGLVWASAPVMAAALGKIGQWFVQDVVSGNKRNNRTNAAIDRPPDPAISLADFEQIGGMLKRELNGRYMFADEARVKFAQLERKLDEQSHDLKEFIRAAVRKDESGSAVPLFRRTEE